MSIELKQKLVGLVELTRRLSPDFSFGEFKSTCESRIRGDHLTLTVTLTHEPRGYFDMEWEALDVRGLALVDEFAPADFAKLTRAQVAVVAPSIARKVNQVARERTITEFNERWGDAHRQVCVQLEYEAEDQLDWDPREGSSWNDGVLHPVFQHVSVVFVFAVVEYITVAQVIEEWRSRQPPFGYLMAQILMDRRDVELMPFEVWTEPRRGALKGWFSKKR